MGFVRQYHTAPNSTAHTQYHPPPPPNSRTRAAVAAQQAAHAAACIKASAFYRNLAGSGPVPNCRGATPHRSAGVLLLCRTEAGGAGFSPVGAGGADGGFHMVANKAFARYLPEPAALLMDAYVLRTLPTLLLAGCVWVYVCACV